MSHQTLWQRFSALYILMVHFISMHSNRPHWDAMRWGNNTQEKDFFFFKKVILRRYITYNWHFWDCCYSNAGFNLYWKKTEHLVSLTSKQTFHCVSLYPWHQIIWGKHCYNIAKRWFIFSALGFKTQTFSFCKPDSPGTTNSLQGNYLSPLYPIPYPVTIYSLHTLTLIANNKMNHSEKQTWTSTTE